jgi:hypothetical protein
MIAGPFLFKLAAAAIALSVVAIIRTISIKEKGGVCV